MLYTQTRCWEANSILDAGAGSGRPSRLFVASYMKPGAHYYNTDFSPKMIELFEAGFKESGICDSDLYKLTRLEDTEMHVVSPFNPEVSTKNIYYGYADNTKLPFPDESFDRYISNSTLNFVDNPQAMVSEAYRVLQNGGMLGISMVKDMTQIKIMPTVTNFIRKYQPDIVQEPKKDDIKHQDTLKALFEDVGFKSVKIVVQKNYFSANPEESFSMMSNFGLVHSFLSNSTADVVNEFKETYMTAHSELFGDNSEDLDGYDFYIIIAKKTFD